MAVDVVEARNAQAVLQTIREQNQRIADLVSRMSQLETQLVLVNRDLTQLRELAQRALAASMGTKATS
jgi:type II secretory pathway component PulJ